MGGGGTKEGEQEAMNNMLPMILMMMDDNEVDADGNPIEKDIFSMLMPMMMMGNGGMNSPSSNSLLPFLLLTLGMNRDIHSLGA